MEENKIQLATERANAEFALTPAGQQVQHMELIQRMGKMLSVSSMVPAAYANNVANCAVAVDLAMRLNSNPLAVMQNLYIVHGTPAWSSKALIAMVNQCGRFSALRFENNGLEGDAYGWRAVANELSTGERLEGEWITWRLVKSEGWASKAGSKWKTMPDQMFRYRAAAFWARIYAPDISCGFMSKDEVEDVRGVEDVTATEVKDRKALMRERAAQRLGMVSENSDKAPTVIEPLENDEL